MENVYCCGCGEDTEYDQGRMVWKSNIDGSYGHKYCVKEHDKKLKRKQVLADQYHPLKCKNCERELLISRTISEETGYRIDEMGECSNYPIKLYKHSGKLAEKLYCERCKVYYEVEQDEKKRLIVGKMIENDSRQCCTIENLCYFTLKHHLTEAIKYSK